MTVTSPSPGGLYAVDALLRSSTAAQGADPALTAARSGDDVVLRFALPGVDPDRDVQVRVLPGLVPRLLVEGERRYRHVERTGDCVHHEVRHGAFRRTFTLPAGLGPECVTTTYGALDGVLTVRLRGAARAARGAAG
ncbi:Hsp20/alpha crystallin family protein [Vallicoccus soli]|uniref:Hsp20/alpha crystallin family protein n=1 Tax=Vallicoccus soli TaxID=2339232 RepID=A0A3A3Z071_9ACTN|nr:Hsp20/alpha crystallin family protein [Vallicoccus soli]RJK96481.1 Hsp20/alpha crystallin family protein [Vallicoccus soli]